ncbi:MAG: hypothetical protein WC961_07390 [Anaerovoracaceae bacterium]
MKITILSRVDYAGSGFKMYEALLQHTNHDVDCFTGKGPNRFDVERGKIIREENRKIAQDRVDASDIIHLKGDWPHNGKYLGLTLPDKPIVITVSGSLFRLSKDGGRERYRFDQYANCTVKTAFSPDLCYPEFTDIWIPHPIQTEDVPVTWRHREVPLFLHTPTNRGLKNTAFVKEVFRALRSMIPCETMILDNVSFKEVMDVKKRTTIFFDQFRQGLYANSAVEAMAYGVPVAAYLSDQAKEQVHDRLHSCPVISMPLDVGLWAKSIVDMVTDEGWMKILSMKSRMWAEKVHSYQAVAKQLDSIYQNIYDGSK